MFGVNLNTIQLGNLTYAALDSISLPVLAVIFLVCVALLHFIPKSSKPILSLPITASPASFFSARSKLPNQLPIPPWYSISSRPDTPVVQTSLAKQLEEMLFAASSQSDAQSSPTARRGSKGRSKAMGMRCGLVTVVEAREDEEV